MHIRHRGGSRRKVSAVLLAGIALVALSGCYPYYYDAHYSHGGGYYKQDHGKRHYYGGGHHYHRGDRYKYKRDRHRRYRHYRRH